MVAPAYLRSLQAIELAIRTGSLRAAAERLGITPAAAGQRVKALEDYLGVDLVVRGRSGLQPTASLQAALPHLAAAFRELETASGLLDVQRGYEIQLAVVPDLADLWLTPRLDPLAADLPNLHFCINGEGEAPPRIGPADCEISFGPLSPDADLLFRDYLLPVCSPEIAARLARLGEQERLEGFPLLHLDVYREDPAAPGWPEWIAGAGFRRTAPERGIRFQRTTRALEAVLADAGLAICGLALVSGLVAEGRLTLPFPVSAGAWTGHVFQARFRNGALSRPQVRRFRDWLRREASQTSEWLQRQVQEAGGCPGHGFGPAADSAEVG